MANQDGKKVLKDFTDHVDSARDIRRSLNEARDPHITTDLKAKARKLVAKEGHAWYMETRDTIAEPVALPSFNIDNAEQYGRAEHYADAFAAVRDTQANDALSAGLNPMVRALGKKKLETMLNDDEGKPLVHIAQNAGKDYADWVRLYANNSELAGLVNRAESGKLTEADIAHVENRAANKRLEAVAKALDKRGVKDPIVRSATQNLIPDTIRAEYTTDKKAYANAAKSLKGDSDKELAKYEKDTKRDMYGFVEAGFGNLIKSAEGSKSVRQLMYNASKAKE